MINFNRDILKNLGFSEGAISHLIRVDRNKFGKYFNIDLFNHYIKRLRINEGLRENILSNSYKLINYNDYNVDVLNIMKLLKGKSINEAKLILYLVEQSFNEAKL